MSKPIFGKTRFLNVWRGVDNPYRIMFFVRRKGRDYELTDGKGYFGVWPTNCLIDVTDNPSDIEEQAKKLNDLLWKAQYDKGASNE